MIFEADELAALATAPGDRAAAALDAGDLPGARAIAGSSVDAHFPIRDIYTAWNAMTVAYVGRELGGDVGDRCLRESLTTVLRPLVEAFRNGVTREAVSQLAQLVRMDAGRLSEATETPDRIVLTANGWAGARLAARPIPGLPPVASLTAEVERLGVRWLGYPPFVVDFPGPDAVRFTVHKDPTEVPAAVFERLGVARDAERIGAAFSVAGAHLFDDDELETLRHPAFALAVAALDAGDERIARRHLALSKTEWYPAHHLLRDLVTAMLSWLHEHDGVKRVWDCVEVAYNRPIMGQMAAQVGELDLRSQVRMLGTLFHQHGMKFSIAETDGGFDFRTAPCGSGGRLVEEGAYAEPKSFATIAGPGLESFGLAEMPVYCMHCPATNRMFLEQGGPYFLLVEPDVRDGRIHGHCSFHVFKEPAAVPDGMYERVGLTR
jgi:hypothetical protein